MNTYFQSEYVYIAWKYIIFLHRYFRPTMRRFVLKAFTTAQSVRKSDKNLIASIGHHEQRRFCGRIFPTKTRGQRVHAGKPREIPVKSKTTTTRKIWPCTRAVFVFGAVEVVINSNSVHASLLNSRRNCFKNERDSDSTQNMRACKKDLSLP